MKSVLERLLIVNVLMPIFLSTHVFAEDSATVSLKGSGKPIQLATLLQSDQHNAGLGRFESSRLRDQNPASRLGNRINAQHALFPATFATPETLRAPAAVGTRLASLFGGNALELQKSPFPKNRVSLPGCLTAAAPPAELATYSKYDQGDSSRSTIDPAAHKKRKAQVQPIRNSVRLLTNIAYAKSDEAAVVEARAECVLKSLDNWAQANALTDMQTADAVLSRDRWVAETVLALHEASKKVKLSSERRAKYDAWLRKIADSTIEAYAMRLGPKSRTNNHRYWAGLSVIAIGGVLEDQDLKAWGRRSFEIGSCQVDANGLLPGELRRGSKALEYHLYALRPLAAIARLHQVNGSPDSLKCFNGFRRLQQAMEKAMKDPADFERYSGMRQKVKFSETSFSAALRLQQLGI
ncbi:alginate lyase family protein [Roseibium algae]|uniref:Alginate lyase family protein n=1 Tax=Roseibium algae TaxID=3123038 RepID=A0ABU8TRA4_9HYPH